ncbi:retention module-containing protein, partial [Aeromonas media]
MRTQIIDKTVVVSSVEGNVQILLADGSSRPLQPGEILQPGAKLNIADDAKLMLAPYDDNPGQAAAAAPAETDTPAEGQPSSSAENSNLPPEIAALQESILQGVDPTKDFEAAAAGGAPAAGGGGGIGGGGGGRGEGGVFVLRCGGGCGPTRGG